MQAKVGLTNEAVAKQGHILSPGGFYEDARTSGAFAGFYRSLAVLGVGVSTQSTAPLSEINDAHSTITRQVQEANPGNAEVDDTFRRLDAKVPTLFSLWSHKDAAAAEEIVDSIGFYAEPEPDLFAMTDADESTTGASSAFFTKGKVRIRSASNATNTQLAQDVSQVDSIFKIMEKYLDFETLAHSDAAVPIYEAVDQFTEDQIDASEFFERASRELALGSGGTNPDEQCNPPDVPFLLVGFAVLEEMERTDVQDQVILLTAALFALRSLFSLVGNPSSGYSEPDNMRALLSCYQPLIGYSDDTLEALMALNQEGSALDPSAIFNERLSGPIRAAVDSARVLNGRHSLPGALLLSLQEIEEVEQNAVALFAPSNSGALPDVKSEESRLAMISIILNSIREFGAIVSFMANDPGLLERARHAMGRFLDWLGQLSIVVNSLSSKLTAAVVLEDSRLINAVHDLESLIVNTKWKNETAFALLRSCGAGALLLGMPDMPNSDSVENEDTEEETIETVAVTDELALFQDLML